MNELTRERLPWIKYDEHDRSIESHVKHLITDGENIWIGQHYRKQFASHGYAWHIFRQEDWHEISGITHWCPLNLPNQQIEQHGKWTKETVWIYRNDRGEIMRAQDEHPGAAVKQVEELYRKGESNGQA